jgi:hypothetical protein
MLEVLEFELLDNDNTIIDVDIDFEGEFVSGATAEDYQRGYNEGYDEGYTNGKKDGYESGYDKGQIDGYSTGYDKGKTDGITEGYDNGYTQGKADGYRDGYNEGYQKGYSQGLKDGAKEEQEKSITITENGTTEILPDDNKVLSKVKVEVNVADSYYDIFWDTIQDYGKRVNYRCAFYIAQSGIIPFNDDTFKPKYDMRPTNAQAIFKACKFTNLIQILKDCNVVLDTSQSTNNNEMYAFSEVTHIPCVSFEKQTTTINSFAFQCFNLIYIEKMVVVKENIWGNNFGDCKKLTTIGEIEGEIGTTFTISSAPLDVDTAKRIITHLVNYAGTENAYVNSVYFSTTTLALLEAEGKTAPNGDIWLNYIDSLGWLT